VSAGVRAWTRLSSSSRARRAAAGVVTVVALASVWHAAAPTWRKLNADHATFAAYDDTARRQAASANAGFTGTLWDQLASYVHGGDRIYFQVPRRPYGTLDLHDTVAALGRWYLAPAVEVTDPAKATVVVSYEADPAELRPDWLVQRQLGERIFFSRARNP
jgi:hypothetical protein